MYIFSVVLESECHSNSFTSKTVAPFLNNNESNVCLKV